VYLSEQQGPFAKNSELKYLLPIKMRISEQLDSYQNKKYAAYFMFF
jgi:hypothetical protein